MGVMNKWIWVGAVMVVFALLGVGGYVIWTNSMLKTKIVSQFSKKIEGGGYLHS